MTACSSRPPMPVPSQSPYPAQPFFCGLGAGHFVCLEKAPCTQNASVQTHPAILIQKDDAKAQGIRANRRQKNWLRGKASVSFERGCVVIRSRGS